MIGQEEKTISDNSTKKKLTEWLFYSKLRSRSFNKYFFSPFKIQENKLDDVCKSYKDDLSTYNKKLHSFIHEMYETKLSFKK